MILHEKLEEKRPLFSLKANFGQITCAAFLLFRIIDVFHTNLSNYIRLLDIHSGIHIEQVHHCLDKMHLGHKMVNRQLLQLLEQKVLSILYKRAPGIVTRLQKKLG